MREAQSGIKRPETDQTSLPGLAVLLRDGQTQLAKLFRGLGGGEEGDYSSSFMEEKDKAHLRRVK